MCLLRITKTGKTTDPITAWKVYEYHPQLRGLRGPVRGHQYRLTEWMYARQEEVFTTGGQPYMSGFHCFLSHRSAKKFCKFLESSIYNPQPGYIFKVFKVEIKGDLTYGVDIHKDAVVASMIYVQNASFPETRFQKLVRFFDVSV